MLARTAVAIAGRSSSKLFGISWCHEKGRRRRKGEHRQSNVLRECIVVPCSFIYGAFQERKPPNLAGDSGIESAWFDCLRLLLSLRRLFLDQTRNYEILKELVPQFEQTIYRSQMTVISSNCVRYSVLRPGLTRLHNQ
jgi:hypothetical protein